MRNGSSMDSGLDGKFLPRLDMILVAEIGGQHNLPFGGYGGSHASFLTQCVKMEAGKA